MARYYIFEGPEREARNSKRSPRPSEVSRAHIVAEVPKPEPRAGIPRCGNFRERRNVYGTMQWTGILGLALAVVFTACGSPTATPAPSGHPSPSVSGRTDEQTQAQIYAAVIRRLVTKDHTFGGAFPPFEYVYVVDGPIPDAGKVPNGLRAAARRFPDAVKQAIEDRLGDLPPLEFISDPNSVRLGKQGIGGVKNDGVIISLGPIETVQGKIQVSNLLWCGGTCGQWLTYVLSEDEGRWKITGTTGPYGIS